VKLEVKSLMALAV